MGSSTLAVWGPWLVFMVSLKVTVVKSSISKSLRNGMVELLAFDMLSVPGQSQMQQSWFDRKIRDFRKCFVRE